MTTKSTLHADATAPQAVRASTDGPTNIVETAASELSELKLKVQQLVDTGKTRVSEWNGGLQDGIREKPFQSLLLAAAVGAAIGLIVGRRS